MSCDHSWWHVRGVQWSDGFADGHPVCSASKANSVYVEDEQISFQCNVTYSGKWAPKMTCSDLGGGVVASTNVGTQPGIVLHTISFAAAPSTNGRQFRCRTHFSADLDPPPGQNEATNVPNYDYTWTSNVITVFCK